jgi:hypothetical protein
MTSSVFSEFVYDQNEKEEYKINLSSSFTLFSFFTKSETKQISSKTISRRSEDISTFNIFSKIKTNIKIYFNRLV